MDQYRKYLFIFLALTGLLNLATGQNQAILTGYLKKSDFLQEPCAGWFNENYKLYDVDHHTLAKILPHPGDISVIILLGTWCGDTKRELPAFLKIIEKLNFAEDQITIIGLDRTKKALEYQENLWNIEFVPTFIFLKDGYEIGRIVEQPLITLEEDIMHILGIRFVPDSGKTVLEHTSGAENGPLFGRCGELALTEDREACSAGNLRAFINNNRATEYHGARLEGTAEVRFVVDTDGLVKGIEIVESSSKLLASEAFRLINRMNSQEQKWHPAMKMDIPMASEYRISIQF